MANQLRLLRSVSIVSGTIIIIGILLMFGGIAQAGSSNLTPIGIGTIVGGGFIFVMGLFFAATEEMLQKTKTN